MNNIKEIIAKQLLEIKAVFLNPKDPFTWASGIKSPIYCDNRITYSYPETRNVIENAFVEMIKEKYSDVDCIVGTATAGIGHAAIIAHILNKPMAYVRASSKKHGRQNQIEGKIAENAKVLVVEDLISTGKSSLECVEILKENKIETVAVIAIFTYQMNKAKENFAQANIKVETLTDLDTLLEVASINNYIETSDINRIKKFRDNPSDESWIML
ncbi:orotate phosphoribosyltransferase [Mycoplasma sp. P36-A1]|uniref:orotate phosphoribosyltransferase n=1 Tax=Mycoplasma sp. P36-A1 TaxID=3252900 RepID=UPI003C2B7985